MWLVSMQTTDGLCCCNFFLVTLKKLKVRYGVLVVFRAQQVFRKALHSSTIRLRVIRRLPSSQQPQTFPQPRRTPSASENARNILQLSADAKQGVTVDQSVVSPLTKMPPAVPPRSASTSLSTTKNKFTQISSTRLIGTVINIQLTKGNWQRHPLIRSYTALRNRHHRLRIRDHRFQNSLQFTNFAIFFKIR